MGLPNLGVGAAAAPEAPDRTPPQRTFRQPSQTPGQTNAPPPRPRSWSRGQDTPGVLSVGQSQPSRHTKNTPLYLPRHRLGLPYLGSLWLQHSGLCKDNTVDFRVGPGPLGTPARGAGWRLTPQDGVSATKLTLGCLSVPLPPPGRAPLGAVQGWHVHPGVSVRATAPHSRGRGHAIEPGSTH